MTTLENSYCVPRTVEEKAELIDTVRRVSPNVQIFDDASKMSEYIYGKASFYMERGMFTFWFDYGDRTEIPVPRFFDLLRDRIAGWRLEQIGFSLIQGKIPYYEFKSNDKVTLSWSEKNQEYGVGFELLDEATWFNITTFTDLLKLISFLKPESR